MGEKAQEPFRLKEAGAARILFPALAAANGIDVNKVTYVNLTGAARLPSLVQGEADAISAFALDLAVIKGLQKQHGVEVGRVMYSDYGVDTYSNQD